MTRIEAKRLFEFVVVGLYPDWNLRQAEVEVWTKTLLPYDYNAAKQAVEQFYVSPEGQYRRPKLHKILELTKKNQPRPETKNTDFETDVFVQCCEHEDPVKIKQYYPVYPAENQNDRDYVLRCAEQMRQDCERLYGGQWIVMQGKSDYELGEVMREYRAVNMV